MLNLWATLGLLLTFGCIVSASSIRTMKVDNEDNDHFDWREKGVISPVKSLGQMGDALSVVLTEGVESLHAIQSQKKVVPLSYVETRDCCTDHGQPKYKGFSCFPIIGGLCSPETYKGGQGICNNNTCTSVASVKGTKYIQEDREDLMKSLIHLTPLVAYIDAGQASFELYQSGIYSDPRCSKTRLDLVVQIVGYGVEGTVEYWIVKNTWGESWGEKGYIRILRGQNMCGIASKVFYPF